MSNWGTPEQGGIPVSAWEFRTRFLSDEVTYDVFYCPFCGIRLAGVLLYERGELSKSPHFSARWAPHLFKCDGEPESIENSKTAAQKNQYIPRGMRLPEALILRAPPRIKLPNLGDTPFKPPASFEDVAQRKRELGSLGRPVPSTYLLQPVVEAYNMVLHDIYEAAKSEKWDNNKRASEIKCTLSSLPLRLENLQIDYQQAFCTPKFLKSQPRIYHSTGTASSPEPGTIQISSSVLTQNGQTTLPFVLRIDTTNISSNSPKSHALIATKLTELLGTSTEIRWYAYGKPILGQNGVVLRITNPDFIYFKVAYQKKP